MRRTLGSVVGLVIACNSGGAKSTGSATTGSSGSAAPTGSSTDKLGGSSAGSGSAQLQPAAVSPKIAAARCAEPCLFLVDTPIAQLVDAYQTACGKPTKELGFDNCKQLDYLRKCVYAAHGYVFKQKRWKKYEQQSWYTADPDFKPTQLSALEHANVRELDTRAKNCKQGLSISPADAARVKTWFENLGKHHAELPKILMTNRDAATAADFVAYVLGELGSEWKLVYDDDMIATYDEQIPEELAAALPAAGTAKLRSINVTRSATFGPDVESLITEGMQLHLVYDEHDTLVAVQAAHFLWD
jgi:hypothetical protein